MNINEQLNQSTKEYGVDQSKSYFKFEKGDNRIRILTAGEVLAIHFFGAGIKASTCYGVEKGCPFHGENATKNKEGKEIKPVIRYTCYVLDVNDKDEKIQLADLPYSVIKQVGEYQSNEDYSFDSFPMPYDITVKYDPESSSPVNTYKVIASPKRQEISSNVKERLEELMGILTPVEHVEKKKNWQINEHKKDGKWISPDQIEKNRKNWREKTNAEYAKKIESGESEPVESIEYPKEDIHPDDIPF
jgi:hypothetical protein